MNYADFFNHILLEAIEPSPTHNVTPGVGAEYLAGPEGDPKQLDSDLGVEGAPKASVEDAKKLWEDNTKMPVGKIDVKEAGLEKIKDFIQKLNSYKGKLDAIPSEERYKPIAILADLVQRDPEMINQYTKLTDDIKTTETKIRVAKAKKKEAEDAARDIEDDIEDTIEDSALPTPRA